MHKHIYSFCGEPGCKAVPYHANTENLVSPAMTSAQVAEYFAYRLDDAVDAKDVLADNDDYAVRLCDGGTCPNSREHWLFIRRNDPIMVVHRPQHYDSKIELSYSDTWAEA